jgi:hypothetical protein
MLMYNLDDAHEHLAELMEAMRNDPDFSEDEFRIYLGHVFAHLNRAWHTRNATDDLDDKEWGEKIHFPTDLKPI